MLLKTYSDAGDDNTWEALHTTCNLFRIAAQHVAGYFGFDYPQIEDAKVSAHLKHVRQLPKNSKEMY